MRKILFRGKRVDNGVWIYGGYAKCNNRDYILPDIDLIGREWVFENIEVIPKTVGQYTGLTDKNGKKIFEGDIVEFTDKYTRKKGRAEIVFEAFKWKYSGCYYGGNPIVWLCIDDTSIEFEIIGNIHDNPELLEVEE